MPISCLRDNLYSHACSSGFTPLQVSALSGTNVLRSFDKETTKSKEKCRPLYNVDTRWMDGWMEGLFLLDIGLLPQYQLFSSKLDAWQP